ncbi:MAG: PAS domain-containing protein [Bacteroidales bacterium]|nr:PAS domain-containing protein [Bacteroidales bacterium]
MKLFSIIKSKDRGQANLAYLYSILGFTYLLIVLLILLGWHSFNYFSKSLKDEYIIESTKSQWLYLNQAMGNSMQMALATGDTAWVGRYYIFLHKADSLISNFKNNIDNQTVLISLNFLEQDHLNNKLIETEIIQKLYSKQLQAAQELANARNYIRIQVANIDFINLQTTIDRREIAAIRLMGVVMFLDETLTNSALLASVKQDASFKKMYNQAYETLGLSIKELVNLLNEKTIAEQATLTRSANLTLMAMEKAAFDQIDAKNYDLAYEILNSQNYAQQKEAYYHVLNAFYSDVRALIAQSIKEQHHRVIVFTVLISLLFLMLNLFWPIVIKDMNQSRKSLLEENAQRVNSEKQLQLITDAIPVLITYLDTDLKYRFVNKTFAQWFHKTKEEIVGQSFESILGKRAHSLFSPMINKVLQGQEVMFQRKLVLENNIEKQVHAVLLPHMVNQKVEGIFATLEDITPLKLKEVELKQSNHFVNSLVDFANEIIITIDIDNNIRQFNKRAELVSGFAPQAVIGKSIYSIFWTPYTIINVKNLIEWTREGRDQEQNLQIPIVTANKEKHSILWNTKLLDYSQSYNLILFGTDISSQKKTEEVLTFRKT